MTAPGSTAPTSTPGRSWSPVFTKRIRPSTDTMAVYYNGRRPELDPATHSVKALVAKNILELRESRNDEYIVAETRRCMTLVTQGLANTAV